MLSTGLVAGKTVDGEIRLQLWQTPVLQEQRD